jgi:hypothetical protein
MLEKPTFLQGVYEFEGHGLHMPGPLSSPLSYKVPFDKRSQLVYFRAGNSSVEIMYVVLTRDGKPMRYFPIGAKSAIHVPLAVVEDLHPESSLEVLVAAPEGASGTVVIDIGLMEF